MMKSKIALFFILIANIILLAHGAIPHRHLPYPVIIESQCDASNHHHHHDLKTVESDHHHNDNDDSIYCLLNKVVSLPKSTVRSADCCSADLDLSFGGYQCILNFFQLKYVRPPVTPWLRPPLLTFSYISYASSVLGLRAPPAI